MKSIVFSVILVLCACAHTYSNTPDDTVRIGSFIKIHKLTPNVYRYICSNGTIPSNGLIYVANHEALMIDAPVGDGVTDSLLAWVPRALGATIKAVVITHWHIQDRMGGVAAVINSHIPSYCMQQTITDATQNNLLHPVTGFKDSIIINVGKKHILCFFPGKGHTDDNIVVWLPDEQILFGGCLVKDMMSTTLGYTVDADMKSWPGTIENVLKRFPDAKVIIPGHFNYGGKELLYHTIALVKKQ